MVLTNRVLSPRQYTEAYSGMYYIKCDTYNECVRCLWNSRIYPSKPIPLTEFPEKYDENKNYVLVQFSKENNYTEYVYCYMTVQKKYLNRFKKFLKGLDESEKDYESM